MTKDSNANVNTVKTLYKGSVVAGRMIGYFQAFIMLIGSLFMIIYGTYLIIKKDHMTDYAKGIVLSVEERPSQRTTDNKTYNITYCFDSKNPDTIPANEDECDCKGTDVSTFKYDIGATVDIKYNPDSNPPNCESRLLTTLKPKTVGTILLIIGIVFLIGTLVHIYLLRNFPIYASFTTLNFLFGRNNSSIFPSINIA